MRLKDKIAVVTGAAHGIGRGIAECFAREGAKVMVLDLDAGGGKSAAEAITEAGGRAFFFKTDISSETQVAAVIDQISTQFSAVHVLCNNAAYISKTWHRSGDAPDEEWEKCLEITLHGTQRVTRAVLPLMSRQKQGSIINISSVQGLVAGRNSAAYTTVKHGLIGFTHSVACDYGPDNIRCNAICPGAIKTRISPEPGSELHQRQISKTFLGRIGTVEEIAQAALFLASDESSYITGAVLPVDGGWTAI
jgi:NAD(P)-dependent dehydrogenase (short-subunit alcohol dehydrogenase family)